MPQNRTYLPRQNYFIHNIPANWHKIQQNTPINQHIFW